MSNKTLFTILGIALLFWAVKGFKSADQLAARNAGRLQQIDWRTADERPYVRADLEDDPEETAYKEKQSKFKLASANTFATNEVGAKKPAAAAAVIVKIRKKKRRRRKRKKTRVYLRHLLRPLAP